MKKSVAHFPGDYCHGSPPKWFEIQEGFDKGKSLFYLDFQTRAGTPQATVVFVHGNPESSYTYRHVIEHLRTSKHCIRIVAMDHIGFGLSDDADFEMVEMHHAANLLQLVRHLDLQQITLAIHDWGGPIGVGAFIEEAWRVRNLVVMNSTVFPMPADGYTYQNFPFPVLPWCITPRIVPNFLWGGLAAYVVSHGSPQSLPTFVAGVARFMWRHATRRISKDEAEYVWSESFRSKTNALSSKRFVSQTPFWGHGYRYVDARHGVQDNHAFYQNIQSKLPQVWGAGPQAIGVAGHFGDWDACGKASVIQQWTTALPQSVPHMHRHPNIGHFIEEYCGKDIAGSVLRLNHLT